MPQADYAAWHDATEAYRRSERARQRQRRIDQQAKGQKVKATTLARYGPDYYTILLASVRGRMTPEQRRANAQQGMQTKRAKYGPDFFYRWSQMALAAKRRKNEQEEG